SRNSTAAVPSTMIFLWCRSPSIERMNFPQALETIFALHKAVDRNIECSRIQAFPLPSTGRGIEGEGWFGSRALEGEVCAHLRSHPQPVSVPLPHSSVENCLAIHFAPIEIPSPLPR